MTAIPHPEPTITDVLAELRMQRMETRTEMMEFRLDVSTRLSDMQRRLDTLFAELAAFRAEYNQHTHE